MKCPFCGSETTATFRVKDGRGTRVACHYCKDITKLRSPYFPKRDDVGYENPFYIEVRNYEGGYNE